jgi:hypothetical protein
VELVVYVYTAQQVTACCQFDEEKMELIALEDLLITPSLTSLPDHQAQSDRHLMTCIIQLRQHPQNPQSAFTGVKQTTHKWGEEKNFNHHGSYST